MLYYLCFGPYWALFSTFILFLGLTYLPEAQPRIAVFCLFQCFEETKYQTESKRNETFGNVIFSSDMIQETWTLRQERREAVTRVEGAPLGHAPCLVGPSKLHRRTTSSYIYLRIP